jgi:hypothetical protein
VLYVIRLPVRKSEPRQKAPGFGITTLGGLVERFAKIKSWGG